jgi:predicted phage terminase large subunit-like protein
MKEITNVPHLEEKARLLGSLLLFTQVFFELRTGRKYEISHPVARESHYISICRSLTKVFRGDVTKLIINIPPRYGKTELMIHFVAWAMARYPDCNFIYASYSHDLAATCTSTVRDIMSMPEFRELFNVEISKSSDAKNDFTTTAGGRIYAAGTGGTVTGLGAGIKGATRFGGCLIIDDAHKPDEALSDVVRERVINRYDNTFQSRKNNGELTPTIIIGQRVHEEDLPETLRVREGDWDTLVLPALDEVKNALYPEMHTTEELLKMQSNRPYDFAGQYQQNPQPAGGGIFKTEWFYLLDEEPKMIATFLTVDTAETNKDYNDATVFSFWGLYEVMQSSSAMNVYALHWIDCAEIRVEAKDLETEFNSFYAACCRHKSKPQLIGIERKSTGVTLASTLNSIQGLNVLDITRTKASGSKTARFIEMQEYVSKKLVSLPRHGRHTQMCIEHMSKITANNTHRHDDIADTAYDAVKIALIDKVLINKFVHPHQEEHTEIINTLANKLRTSQRLRSKRKW